MHIDRHEYPMVTIIWQFSVECFLPKRGLMHSRNFFFFFLNDRAPTEIYPLPPPAALPISGETAVSPTAETRTAKYWAPVRRIEGAYGARTLMCSCPPMAAYGE